MRLVRNLSFLFFLAVVLSANLAELRARTDCPAGCECLFEGGVSVSCGLLENCGGDGFCGDVMNMCSEECGTFKDFECVGGSQCTGECECVLFD
jgi:hypothetical protein